MNKLYFTFLFLLIHLCIALMPQKVHAREVITYPWFDGKFQEDHYFLALLTLALENSKKQYGDYQLVQAQQAMYQGRSLLEVNDNAHLNVVWTMTSSDREQFLNPVRVPLLRGLGGIRIFLIEEGRQQVFSAVTSEPVLKALTAAQGKSWPDADILAANKYGLITPAGHESLFKMLQHGRYDYMPRGLHEAWNEAQIFEGLAVEQTIALKYFSPFYFFVSNKNEALKKRIEYGLKQAEKNGSFLTFFNSHPVTKNIVKKAQLNKRTVYELANPFLTAETQMLLSDKSIGLDF